MDNNENDIDYNEQMIIIPGYSNRIKQKTFFLFHNHNFHHHHRMNRNSSGSRIRLLNKITTAYTFSRNVCGSNTGE